MSQQSSILKYESSKLKNQQDAASSYSDSQSRSSSSSSMEAQMPFCYCFCGRPYKQYMSLIQHLKTKHTPFYYQWKGSIPRLLFESIDENTGQKIIKIGTELREDGGMKGRRRGRRTTKNSHLEAQYSKPQTTEQIPVNGKSIGRPAVGQGKPLLENKSFVDKFFKQYRKSKNTQKSQDQELQLQTPIKRKYKRRDPQSQSLPKLKKAQTNQQDQSSSQNVQPIIIPTPLPKKEVQAETEKKPEIQVSLVSPKKTQEELETRSTKVPFSSLRLIASCYEQIALLYEKIGKEYQKIE